MFYWCSLGKTVGMLVFLPWDLKKLCLKIVYRILHLLEVLLLPFVFALIIAFNLTGNYLRVAIHYHNCLTTLARSSPAIKALYPASLFVVGKSNQTINSTSSPFGLQSTTPTPPACLVDDLSVWILHGWNSPTPWPSMFVNFAVNSAITCHFMAMRGLFYTSNSLNSIAHSTIRPATSGLFIALCIGLSIKKITMFA